MERRLAVAVAVTLLVVTSGCLGILGGGGGGGGGDGGGETTTATTATTTTPAPTTTTSTPTTGTDPGEENQGPLAGQAEVHREQLRAAGSFTSSISLDVSRGERSQQARIAYRIDFEEERYLSDVSLTQAGTTISGETYTAGETTYMRQASPDGEIQYQSDTEPYEGQVQPVDVRDAMGGPQFGTELAGYDLERDGTGQFQGQEMKRYTASGPDAMNTEPPQGVEEVTGFEVTVLVDDRGIVRRISLHIEGLSSDDQEFVQDATIEITDVGGTDVPEPGWIDEAESGTGDGGG